MYDWNESQISCNGQVTKPLPVKTTRLLSLLPGSFEYDVQISLKMEYSDTSEVSVQIEPTNGGLVP